MAKPTRVALLDGGEMYTKEYLMYWNVPSEAKAVLPSYGVLIDHRDGLFLFDTGFDLQVYKESFGAEMAFAAQTPSQTLPAQLALLGLEPGDVTHVINSHYHLDHCGGNKHCHNARTICHAFELEAALKPLPFEAIAYTDRSFLPKLPGEPTLDMYTPYFETLRGDQEIAAGLHLFETPGHTAGHYSLMVRLPGRRPMLFTGDACYAKKGMDLMAIPSTHVDPVKGYQSMERLKTLAEQHDAELFFAHDSESYRHYLKAPAWYG
jgi:glyoxylase-like metal-dependent hydrolase (beta-lactamase superfamily II)